MNIEINRYGKTVPTSYSWQFGIGSDHAFLLHRTDICEHLKLIHDELGMKYVRFHGIFDDDMLCVQRLSDYRPFRAVPHSSKIEEINFLQVGKVYDNVLACGMKPFVELSFMPSALASGKKTGIRYLNNITQPKSLTRWRDFIRRFITFLIDRYGKDEVESWYFEVWNEPDLKIFFKGKQKDYFRLYEVTARAVKSVDSKLRVGGPSSSACKWLKEFIRFCKQNNVPCDFVSTHHYPGDAFGNTFGVKEAFKMMATAKETAKKKVGLSHAMEKLFFHPEVYKKWKKGILSRLDESARAETEGLPLILTEWNSMAVFASPIHDEKYSAAFVIKTCLDGAHLMDGYMFWCCSDVYEEQFMLGTPFHGGFGLVNNCGIPKPNFWAFKMLSRLYPKRLSLPQIDSDVEYAAFTDDSNMQVLVYTQDPDSERHDVHQVDLHVDMRAVSVKICRIDDDHCNPKREWTALGSPDVLTRSQCNLIKERTKLHDEDAEFSAGDDGTHVGFTIGTNEVVLVTFKAM